MSLSFVKIKNELIFTEITLKIFNNVFNTNIMSDAKTEIKNTLSLLYVNVPKETAATLCIIL